MTKKQILLNQVDEIMDSFDFSKVASVMKHLNWTWHNRETPPDEYEIRKNARELMKQSIKTDQGMSTGGWEITLVSGEEDGKKWARIDLAFAIEQTFNDGVDYDEE
jgi:RNA polymerase-interacting CarD/CdnL/TRCF family regulator